ncbi:MAG: type II secretion system F family protein [Eubacteriales bacterium]
MDSILDLLKPITALLMVATGAGVHFSLQSRADELADEIREYKFKFRFLSSVGFYLQKKIPYDFSSGYDRKARAKLAELYGHRNANTFFQVHIAQKLALIAGLIFLLGFITLVGDVEYSFYIFGLILVGLVYYWVDKELDKKLENRKRDILTDLPEFINTLALLINAGLPFTGAIQKIVRDGDLLRPWYRELNFLMADVSAGKPISQAYEDLAQRCRIPEITRFVSTVLQNLNRGSSDMVNVLRVLAQEAWEKRKDIAKKRGEEASSKLVLPMVMVFLAVAIIVLAPAVMTMSK